MIGLLEFSTEHTRIGACVPNAPRILRDELVGVVIDSLDCESVVRSALSLLEMARAPQVRNRCVEVAQKHFSLVEGVRSI